MCWLSPDHHTVDFEIMTEGEVRLHPISLCKRHILDRAGFSSQNNSNYSLMTPDLCVCNFLT